MKKIVSIVLALVMGLAFAGCGKKDVEKIPDLETVFTMDEGDINSILPGHSINELKEAWGAPNDSGANESVWYLKDMRLIVSVNWLGEVVVCGVEKEEVPGTISGAEYEYLTVGKDHYELCSDSPYHASDKDKKIAKIKNGDMTFHVYSVKGTDQYLYCRWEHEGSMYKLVQD